MKVLPIILFLFTSCSKQDLSKWNTDRRPQVIEISQRYTDPPKWLNDTTWKIDTIVYYYLPRSVDTMAYHGLVDTMHSTCPIQGTKNLFWEIRRYEIKTY